MNNPFIKSLKKRPYFIYLLISLSFVPFFYVFAHNFIESETVDYLNRDFASFWVGGYMRLHGLDPYSSTEWINTRLHFGVTWNPSSIFPLPLPLDNFLIPLGLISFKEAYKVWITLAAFLIILSSMFLLEAWDDTQNKFVYIFPILACTFLFRPVFLMIIGGQIAQFHLFIITIAILLWRSNHWLMGGLILGLISLKPQIGIPTLGLISIWLIAQKQWRAILGILVTNIMLFFIGWLENPKWVFLFLNQGQTLLDNVFGINPSIWGITNLLCSGNRYCGLGAAIITIVLVGFITLFVLMRKQNTDPFFAISMAVTFTAFTPPYMWIYDQVLLLIPIIYVAGRIASVSQGYLRSFLFFLFIDIVAYGLLIVAAIIKNDSWSGLMPAALLIILVGYNMNRYLPSNAKSVPV